MKQPRVQQRTDTLLEILRCPDCGSRLTAGAELLRCTAGHEFPVVRNVPRFVSSDLYADNFGYEWTRFRRTQHDRSQQGSWERDLYGHGVVSGGQESERTFFLETGLTPEELRGKRILDVGCGMGRFADVAAAYGAHVVGIDLSRAVESARENLADRDNVDIIQADLRRPPFADASFDVIYSIGVLHHTPDTHASFRGLLRFLRPGGTIAIWLYHRSPWRRRWLPPSYVFSDILRRATTHLPHDVLLAMCRARARLDDLPVPLLRRVAGKLVPASDHPNFEWRVLDTFDWYSPRYQWKHTDVEVIGWFDDAGLVDVRSLGVPVAVRGSLPA